MRTQVGLPSEAPPPPSTPTPPVAVCLKKKLSDIKFVIVDTETTGPDPETDQAIEVAVRGWSISKRKKFPRIFETRLDPGILIPPASSAVHHITNQDLVGCPTLADVLPDLLLAVGDSPILAFNAEFDRAILRQTPLYERYWIDVYRLAMRTWHVGQENQDGFKLGSLRQQELRYWLGLPTVDGNAHSAAADITVTGMIFQAATDRYLAAGHPDDHDAFVQWLQSPILHQTFPIGGAFLAGKTPEELEDWQLRKLFDPNNVMREALVRFNVLDYARPEYMRRRLDSSFSYKPRGR